MNGIGNPLVLTSMALASVSLAKEKNFIKENWKPILGIGATLGITYVVWNIYSDWKKESNPTPGGLEVDPKKPAPTISMAEAAVKADRLQAAMKSFGKASEKEILEIRNVLQDLTYNDFILVNKAFGERGYVAITGISQGWPAPEKNLVYWLTNELEPEDLNAMREILPGVF